MGVMFNTKQKFERVYRVLKGLRSKDSDESIKKLFIDNREFGKS